MNFLKRFGPQVLGYPAFVWFLFFLGIPLLMVFCLSVLSRGTYGGVEWVFTLDNIQNVFRPIYFTIFLKTIRLALITSFTCLIVGYPMAWAIATARPKWRNVFLIALAIPFLTNLIIRVYSIKLFVGMDGPLQLLLNTLGIPFDPFGISQNQLLVFYGMVTTYLPFMVFPLYASLEKLDFSLVEAAQDLGCRNWKILLTVIVPNTKAAMVSGFTLVFVPSLGEFVIPDLLGGAKTMLLGNLITEQFLKARNWPLGAALAAVLMLILVAVPPLYRRITR